MKTPAIIPVSGKTNVEIVVEQLEKLIVDGYWEPEDRIWSEATLCGKFNVGRSTIREAVNMLKAKNLLYTVPGLGTFVGKAADVDANFVLTHIPDPKSGADLLNIMELRLGLEPVNAAFAARRASDEEIAALRDSHEKRRAFDAVPIPVFARNDMEFHMIIARAARNPVAFDVMNMVEKFFIEQQILTSHQASRRQTAMRHHERVLKAVCDRRADLAERAMRDHMEETYEHVASLVTLSKRMSRRFRAREPARP